MKTYVKVLIAVPLVLFLILWIKWTVMIFHAAKVIAFGGCQ